MLGYYIIINKLLTKYIFDVTIVFMRLLQNLINGLVDVIYPKSCSICRKKLACQSPNEFVCAECWAKIKRNIPPFCYSCGRPLTGKKFIKNICIGCIKKPLHFDRAFSPCSYEGVIKELIHTFKYKNRDYLGNILAEFMIEFINEYNLPMKFIDLVMPIPLYKTKLREREFNQAGILAKYISLKFDKNLQEDRLLRKRNTKTQTNLKEHMRFLNVRDSFIINNGNNIKGQNILLIDDILTTGATCSEAAFVLKNAGANIVYALTLAS